VRVAGITPDAIATFQRRRQEAKISNRTINMGAGALLRVVEYCGHLRALKENLKNIHPLPEPESLVGRALSVEEQDRLFKTAQANPEWEHVYCAAVVAANTSMCSVEVRRLRRRDVDLFSKSVSVPFGKNKHRVRLLPLLPAAVKALGRMLERLDQLGFTSPDNYLWCACKWNRLDPTMPQSRWDSAWHALRDEAKLPGLRFHDLRHTVITELAETTTPDSVIQSIAGHVTKRMLDRYSHIRLAAKRKALEMVEEQREQKRREDHGKGETETVQ
jgi:integrase